MISMDIRHFVAELWQLQISIKVCSLKWLGEEKPGTGSCVLRTLHKSGCDQASSFLRAEQRPSVELLVNNTGPFKLPFWNALQLHHFLNSIPNPQCFGHHLTTFEELCSYEGILSQVLSKKRKTDNVLIKLERIDQL